MANRDQILQGAEKLLARGKLDAALKEYLRVLEENPKDISTLNKVGDLYVRINRPSDSIPFFMRIADFYAKDGFFLKAIAIYKKINKIDPARLEVYEQLADLYHKQGLTQDARSQYQVLADHYSKNNRPEDAIAAYKKMVAVEPGDLKIQARLADLYRVNRQINHAVAQYGVIGAALAERGAHDEAIAVFQKALELVPGDADVQRKLVRSMLAQKNAAAAIAILKKAPATPEGLALLAEAQFDTGDPAEAVRSAEQGLALDPASEGCRVQLSRVRIAQGNADASLAAIFPAVDAAVSVKDFARAAAHLAPILEAQPSYGPALEKLAEVREAEGRRPEAAALLSTAAAEAVRLGNSDVAVAMYRRALALSPGDAEATARLKELAPSASPAPAPPAPEIEVEVEVEDEPPAPATPAAVSVAPPVFPTPTPPPAGVPPPPVAAAPSAPPEDREVETLVVEAEVFARYGLADKAVERLRTLVRRRPDLVRARERMIELMAESQNPALAREVDELAAYYRSTARNADAENLLRRYGSPAAAPPAPAPPLAAASGAAAAQAPPPAALPPPAAPAESAFDEFGLEGGPHPVLPEPLPVPELLEDFEPEPAAPAPPPPSAAMTPAPPRAAAPPPAAPPPPAAAPPPDITAPRATSSVRIAAPSDSEFVSYEELGSLLEEEMQKAGEAPEGETAAPEPVLDEQSLFADEQQFFNLAEELEKELAEEAPVPDAPALGGPEGEASLEEIFREFKKGVEQQLSAEDYETHFNLGIAYKEMGLTDEAIGEFQLASKDPARMVECCSMLGLCFLEKGMPQLAIKWYRKGLESPDIKEVETVGLLYDLGGVYQDTGDLELAYRTFLEVYGLNTNYRDIVNRVKELEAVKKN
ncbi:MAG TPA: tetratricopeptide repeat protein [Thermoanaerobaculia bacterium]|nr:tetratricopeptide repeat protein [Thermoanaerobaculia bacterium]